MIIKTGVGLLCHRTSSLQRLRLLFNHNNNTSYLRNISSSSVRMSSLYVKNSVDDDRLQINLDINVGNTLKTFSLNRLKNEELGLALERLRTSIEKKSKKKKKKKVKDSSAGESQGAEAQPEECNRIRLDILQDGIPIPLSVRNEDAWVNDAILCVGEEKISVVYNGPSVKIDNLCTTIMEGYPMFPNVEYEFCDVDSCEFHWKCVGKSNVDVIKSDGSNGKFDLSDTSCGLSFTPTVDDLDRHVVLVCVPKTKTGDKVGKTQMAVSESAVTRGPGTCSFEKRFSYTKDRSKFEELRVISYNILAEVYTNTEFAKTELFVHCPEYAIDMAYRKQLLLKEITGYQADVVCLQEVDRSVFVRFLSPGLGLQGFEGFFRPKKGGVSEGCAMFIRKDKFKVVGQMDIALSEYLSTDESCRDLWEKCCKVPALKEKLESRSSILQVTVVESVDRPGQFVCVANTHLFFHPLACNIRLVHAATALRYLLAIRAAYQHEGKNLAMVLCGDFNSSPDVGIYQLMTSQFVPTDHADWMSAGETEAVKDVELSHSLDIVSACGTPPFTHYGAPIQCTLDYIFAEISQLEVVSSVPLLDEADVQTHTYLPNPLVPSDHLALVADLRFKPTTTTVES